MATLPAFFLRWIEATHPEADAKTAHARAQRDPYRLRSLPQDDLFFFCKRIDNSRLVREPDPRAMGACWSAIGVASLAVAILAGVLVPGAASTTAGYRLESLRAEERRLVEERRTLELQEAELLSPARLDRLAHNQNLVTPKSDQVFHLEGDRPGAVVAMVKNR
jgi:hypothetical protein